MQLPTIEMPTELAQKKLDEYRDFRLADLAEDEKVMKRSFKALAEGKKLFNLYEVMRRAGTNHLVQPRLGIARADWKEVYFTGWANGEGEFHPTKSTKDSNAKNNSIYCRGKSFPEEIDKWGWSGYWGKDGEELLRSVVPVIPQQLKPPHKLLNYHILFEPQWETLPGRDPILCKRISPNMFIILASWDLTDLELAVLEGTLE